MSPQTGPQRTLEDIERLERVLLAKRLADLGMGSMDVIALLLLPDLLENQVLSWAGQTAGISGLIPPSLPARQVIHLLQAVKAQILGAPSPSVGQDLWQKTEQV